MSMLNQSRRGKRQRGNAVVEVALMAPWIFFLFVGVYDCGFYSFALISTQNAARQAALSAAQASTATVTPCQAALGELNLLLNTPTSCTTAAGVSNSAPVGVDLTNITGIDGDPAVRATVAYRTIPLIPIPGVLTGRATIQRISEVRTITP